MVHWFKRSLGSFWQEVKRGMGIYTAPLAALRHTHNNPGSYLTRLIAIYRHHRAL